MTWGVCLNRGLRRFSQMGYDAPLPFVPGFWVPACAGMTGLAVMTVGVLSEPQITQIAQMGYDAPRPFVSGFWVPASAGMTWECAGMTGLAVMTGVAVMTWGLRERRSVIGVFSLGCCLLLRGRRVWRRRLRCRCCLWPLVRRR